MQFFFSLSLLATGPERDNRKHSKDCFLSPLKLLSQHCGGGERPEEKHEGRDAEEKEGRGEEEGGRE